MIERPNGLPISRRKRTAKTAKIAMISRAKRSAAWAGWAGAPLERQTEASATDGDVTRAPARGGIAPTGSTRSTTGLRRRSGCASLARNHTPHHGLWYHGRYVFSEQDNARRPERQRARFKNATTVRLRPAQRLAVQLPQARRKTTHQKRTILRAQRSAGTAGWAAAVGILAGFLSIRYGQVLLHCDGYSFALLRSACRRCPRMDGSFFDQQH